ncbi:UNVERIFIED_CONTAM: hypothetical protein HDU68_004106 [Siphonaria sp. JEL0065]|nr:hypothetical protein HDU68_004106 [Siphonaria sp. JEL0065]
MPHWIRSLLTANASKDLGLISSSLEAASTPDALGKLVQGSRKAVELVAAGAVWLQWDLTLANPTVHDYTKRFFKPNFTLPECSTLPESECRDLLLWLEQHHLAGIAELANHAVRLGNITLLDFIATEFTEHLRGTDSPYYTRARLLEAVALDGFYRTVPLASPQSEFAQQLPKYLVKLDEDLEDGILENEIYNTDYAEVRDQSHLSILQHVFTSTLKFIGPAYGYDNNEAVVIPDNYNADAWQPTEEEIRSIVAMSLYRESTRMLRYLVVNLKLPINNPKIYATLRFDDYQLYNLQHLLRSLRFLVAKGDTETQKLVWDVLKSRDTALARVIYPFCCLEGFEPDEYNEIVWSRAEAVGLSSFGPAVEVVKEMVEASDNESDKEVVLTFLASKNVI